MTIIQDAIDQYKPTAMFAMYSGGDDSICALHLSMRYPEFTAACLIDTGIAIRECHQHAAKVCSGLGVKLLKYKSSYDYKKLVRKYGFPNGGQHTTMYIMLKERAVRALVRDHKTKRSDKILLITGVRKAESKRRMETVTSPIVAVGAQVWVAPMWEWSDEYKHQYMNKHQLPRNPIKPYLHISGDCLCGAYAEKGELELLKFFPEAYQEIKQLQEEVMKKYPWGWDEKIPKWWNGYKSGQLFLSKDFQPLCWSCERAKSAVMSESEA